MPGPMIRTRVNNPERVFLNSSDDPRTTVEQGFSKFICTFDTPILGAMKTMMLRATIPNAQVNIPDYALEFWYYQLDSASEVPTDNALRCVRLYPSWYNGTGAIPYTLNRFFTDPGDLVTQLNVASSAGGDDVTYNPYWEADDITFTYDATFKKIYIVGNTAGKYYAIAGWNDPLVNTARALITMPNYTGVGTTVQPSVQGYTMNLRVGYAMSGNASGYQVNQATGANPQYANLNNTTWATGTAVPPDSFPNLVYSQCVYLYSNIVAGVSLGSGGQHNLLAVVPSNAPQLGVIQYSALTVNMLSKLVDTIYEISIEMRDDANYPFVLPDSAQVNIELAFLYTE